MPALPLNLAFLSFLFASASNPEQKNINSLLLVCRVLQSCFDGLKNFVPFDDTLVTLTTLHGEIFHAMLCDVSMPDHSIPFATLQTISCLFKAMTEPSFRTSLRSCASRGGWLTGPAATSSSHRHSLTCSPARWTPSRPARRT
jgi:hypothetical protein